MRLCELCVRTLLRSTPILPCRNGALISARSPFRPIGSVASQASAMSPGAQLKAHMKRQEDADDVLSPRTCTMGTSFSLLPCVL